MVYTYTSKAGKDYIAEFLDHLPQKETNRGLSILEKLETSSSTSSLIEQFPNLDVKPVWGKVWEIRFFDHNRFFYFINENSDVIVLHAMKKKENKISKKTMRIIVKRYKECVN